VKEQRMADSHPQRHESTAQADRPPWEIGRPQPTFLELSSAGSFRGRVLDVGCGTGEHVLLAAQLGLEATGIDRDPHALRAAEEKAAARDLTAKFVRHDALQLAELGEAYDTVLDCALFHAFGDVDRAMYVNSLRGVTGPGGRLFILCYSDQQGGTVVVPPHRVTRGDIEAAFADGWRIDSILPTTIDVTIDPAGIPAWLLTATRI